MKKNTNFCILLLAFSLLFLFLPWAKAQETSTKLKVVTEQANIRLKPDIGSVIIQQVPQGTILESTGKEGEWHLIKITTDEGEEVSGYVHESMIIVIERAPEEKEEIRLELEKTEKIEKKPTIQPIPSPPPSRQPSETRFELCLSGGGNYISGGDLNSGAQGFADYYSDFLEIKGEGEVKPVHLSYIFSGEITFPLSPNFFLGLGVDYFLEERESLVRFQDGTSTETLIRPKIQALPLRLFISYYPLPYFYVKTGIEYYFAKCAYFYRYQGEDFWKEWHGKASTQGSGILGGLGVDLRLSSAISFIVEATGRYAKISGFKGEDRTKDSDGGDYITEGTLYFYQGKTSGGGSYPLLFIKEKKPSEDVRISDPRKAIVDYSGINLKAGFKIKF